MGKEDTRFLPGSYKTWLCNAAIFALICAAFAAGILIGPIVSSQGKQDAKQTRCSPDDAWEKQTEERNCVSQKELTTFMGKWSQSLDELLEEKMVNVSRRKINPAIRKLLRERNAATKKTLRGIVTFVVCV